MSPFSEIRIPKANSQKQGRSGLRPPSSRDTMTASRAFQDDRGLGGDGHGDRDRDEDENNLRENHHAQQLQVQVQQTLSFQFRDQEVPILCHPSISYDDILLATSSNLFQNWIDKTSRVFGSRQIELHNITIESLHILGDDGDRSGTNCSGRHVERINMKVESELRDEDLNLQQCELIQEYCCLRSSSVGILVALRCVEDDTVWSVLVDQPRLNVGAVSALELPVAYLDEDKNILVGPQAKEVEEVCGVSMKVSDLINLSQSAYENNSIYNASGLCPSLGNSSEFVKILYARKNIKKTQMKIIRKRLSQMREEGAVMSLRVVPLEDVWKVSADMKVVCALFLLEKAGFENEKYQKPVYVEDEGRGGSLRTRLNSFLGSSEDENKGGFKTGLNSLFGRRSTSFSGQF